MRRMLRASALAGTILMAIGLLAPAAGAQVPPGGGPWNVRLLEGGIGDMRKLPESAPVLAAGQPTSLTAWVRPQRVQPGEVALLAIGAAESCRCLILVDGRPGLRIGDDLLVARRPLAAGRMQHIAATHDGQNARLFVNGAEVASAPMRSAAATPLIGVGPVFAGRSHFGGELVDAKVEALALPPSEVAARAAAAPRFELVQMRDVGAGWKFQKSAIIGLFDQQDAWTVPTAKAPPPAPVAKPVPALPSLALLGDGRWQLNGWQLASAEDAGGADGATLSRGGTASGKWLAATVPGTVLGTLVDRGVYPDPYVGLANMAIPERLSQQDWWYRASFEVPAEAAGRQLALRFNGINYAAEIWLNGERLGDMKGAFIRGEFPVKPRAGANVVAVRISPPPHPGIPHEQSILAGPGENGGQLAYDGPTFIATEGWDWVPAMRDRNSGLWRPVELVARGGVTLGDPQVITDLPLPRTDSADIHIAVPVRNGGPAPVRATVKLSAAGVPLARTIDLPPGETVLRFSPATDPALRVANPALWWPNGMGAQALQQLAVTVETDGTVSDTHRERFGIREFSYELSLFDSGGRLRRVDVHMTDAGLAGVRPVDQRHEAIKESPAGWAMSLTPAGEASKAVRNVAETIPFPHLTIRANGVPVAARGGNWGMDDAMKRAGRERLEPAFRLHAQANLNLIRNWMGNSTQPEFYDLADEYGMLVFNDFWQSTQDYQLEPGDPQLFLKNAEDTIKRVRNHPSVLLWFGRNEGVPAPVLQNGLDDLIARLDGTRLYMGSSNSVNLQGSGPYNWRPPVGYFTDLASGFSVETGTPSLATLEALEAMIPEADRWPISDTLAYHDWHFGGNGDTKSFMAAVETMYGAPTGFADFERKAQMMNMESHKAMIEGMFAHLWTKNSGRLFWMTHPAWPSNAWQIYSSDWDTHAAYYAVKSAAEPLHVQMNLPDFGLSVVNTGREARPGLTATARLLAPDGSELWRRDDKLNSAANATTQLAPLPLAAQFAKSPLLLVQLTLSDSAGVVSRNFYWQGQTPADVKGLNALPVQPLSVAASRQADGAEQLLRVTLSNSGTTPALMAKLTLLDAAGARILPAYYADNYVSLMPGETREIAIRTPSATPAAAIALRGWNVEPARVAIP